VGPRIGEELKGKAILAIFWALVGIIIYIWWRFEFTFGIAAIAALVHDILITVGIFAIFGKEISLPVVAALLTIVGYSLNDTIVVFDRIRERQRLEGDRPIGEQVDNAVTATLTRTLYTSGTTLMPLFALILFGGSTLVWFAVALAAGVIVGSWSSIALAPSLLTLWSRRAVAPSRAS